MNIVEVRRDGGDVAHPMGLMRSWLDAHHVTSNLFRLDGEFFHLEFGVGAKRQPSRKLSAAT
jgi:hypothetical protein